jgi:membrane protein
VSAPDEHRGSEPSDIAAGLSEWFSPAALRRRVRRARHIIEGTYHEWRNDRTMRLGAALAYYGVFAVTPLIVFSIAIAQMLLGRADVQQFVSDGLIQLFGVEGEQMAMTVTDELDSFSEQAGLGTLALATLVVSASFMVVALEDMFLTIWHVPVQSGMRRAIKRRLTSFLVVFSTSAVLIAIVVVHTFAGILDTILPDATGLDALVELTTVLASWGVLAVAVVLLMKFMTPEEISWRIAFAGGLLTAILATIGAWGLSVYFRTIGGASLTGVAGGVLLVLVFIYYEAQILLVGIQFVKVLHRNRRRPPNA